MRLNKANRLLKACCLENFDAKRLYENGPHYYLNVSAGDETAILDGEFTADMLEAIAVWMRNKEASHAIDATNETC